MNKPKIQVARNLPKPKEPTEADLICLQKEGEKWAEAIREKAHIEPIGCALCEKLRAELVELKAEVRYLKRRVDSL